MCAPHHCTALRLLCLTFSRVPVSRGCVTILGSLPVNACDRCRRSLRKWCATHVLCAEVVLPYVHDSQHSGRPKPRRVRPTARCPLHLSVRPQQTRFQAMSDGIVGRIDELGSRIDELDKSITQLIDQTGMEAAASGPARAVPSPHRA